MSNCRTLKEYFIYPFVAFLVVLTLSCNQKNNEFSGSIKKNNFNEKLILIHGLTNKYPWSDSFLEKCASIWGSGNVFVVYLNDSEITYERTIDSKTIIYCGLNDKKAGDKNIEEQVELLHQKIQILEETKSLGKHFYIIAHSMGGLVGRRYIYEHPYVVKGLVTLGTPHHGSPLADSFKWIGFFAGATDAIDNLRPLFLKTFNQKFPVNGAPLAENGTICTIRGDCDGTDCFGWGGELLFGWIYIKNTINRDNDGLVPFDSAIVDGANNIWDFEDFDHFDLVQEPSVAEKASQCFINH